MAASSGSRFFLWFVFLCFVVAGYLLWRKSAPEPTSKSGLFLTPEEISLLLYADNDERAKFAFEKKLERRIDGDGTRKYKSQQFPDYNHWGVLIPPNKDYYYISFPEPYMLKEFIGQFHKYKRLGESPLCKERYLVSEKYVVGEKRFKEGVDCYIVIIMKTPDTEQSMNQPIYCYY